MDALTGEGTPDVLKARMRTAVVAADVPRNEKVVGSIPTDGCSKSPVRGLFVDECERQPQTWEAQGHNVEFDAE
jgi:hypothetical protein